MVASSFESVAGLSAATPYASLALKAISKQFRSVKHAISNQLRDVSRVLGENFMSSPSSSSRGETMTTPWLKCVDQGLRKQKSSENSSLGFLENNQPVWRPQRGLPERAVSELKAWLFEHFLHPSVLSFDFSNVVLSAKKQACCNYPLLISTHIIII